MASGIDVETVIAQPDTWEYALGHVVMELLREGKYVLVKWEKPIPRRRVKNIGEHDVIDLGSQHI